MRRHWLDNLRWVTVVLVLIYHVFYYYNNKGVAGGIGGFGGTQPQDVILYILYPWFMVLLFLVAGISARYALQRQTTKEFVCSRTFKLLVPATIGILVLWWITGYYNILTAEYVQQTEIFAAIPEAIRVPMIYFISCTMGSGPLWFIQELWLFSLLLLLLRHLDKGDKLWTMCKNANKASILLAGVLIWLGEQTMISNPNPASYIGIINLYKPLAYVVPFLMGYYLFSHDEVIEKVVAMRKPLTAVAIISGITLIATTFGQDYSSADYMGSVLTNLYAYSMMLALLGVFKYHFDTTNKFAGYMTRSSFGLYVVHYIIITAIGYYLKSATELPAVAIYAILLVAVIGGSPLIYELLHRIPIVRWCIFGIKQ